MLNEAHAKKEFIYGKINNNSLSKLPKPIYNEYFFKEAKITNSKGGGNGQRGSRSL
jgi:hypothetical protein